MNSQLVMVTVVDSSQFCMPPDFFLKAVTDIRLIVIVTVVLAGHDSYYLPCRYWWG